MTDCCFRCLWSVAQKDDTTRMHTYGNVQWVQQKSNGGSGGKGHPFVFDAIFGPVQADSGPEQLGLR